MGEARLGLVRCGEVRPGTARCGQAGRGRVRLGEGANGTKRLIQHKIMWTRKPKYTTSSGVSLLQAKRGIPPAFGKWELIRLVSSFFLSWNQ